MRKVKEFLLKIKIEVTVLLQSIGFSLRCFRLLRHGQLPKYQILQLAHRLEKGLLNDKPKPFWGWEKANKMISLMKVNEDDFANSTGRGVLNAFIESKKKSDNPKEREMAVSFEKAHPSIVNASILGGKIQLRKEDITVSQKKIVEFFFNSRHSCREYLDTIVSKEEIEAAISIALKCPSACNRQVTNCYVYQSRDLQTIILTANIRAYEMGEFYDWFVSPSIFAGYLSLSLHLYGIGSCVYRKQLYGHHPYNEKIRKKCNIPADEMIMLELRFGYYKDEFNVAVSNRHHADEITSFIKE